LVFQLLEGRVDRARARLPHPAAARGYLLDDLVAVPRLLGEQGQRRSAHISAPHPWPARWLVTHPESRAAKPGPMPHKALRARPAASWRSPVPAVLGVLHVLG